MSRLYIFLCATQKIINLVKQGKKNAEIDPYEIAQKSKFMHNIYIPAIKRIIEQGFEIKFPDINFTHISTKFLLLQACSSIPVSKSVSSLLMLTSLLYVPASVNDN